MSIKTDPFSLPSAQAAATLFFSALAAILFIFVTPSFASNEGVPEHEEEKANVNPHNFNDKSNCGLCHTSDPPALNFDSVTTCTRCHKGNVGDHPVTRHPIGRPTGKQVPVILPLSEERQMVCYTCHDQHNRSGHPKMLRVEYKRLCALCHVDY